MSGEIGRIASTTELPAGIVVEARVRRGMSVVGRVILHRGAKLVHLGDCASRITTRRADALHFGFYDHALLANGREPYDQFGCAYLPLPYAALRALPLPGYGALLVQKEVDAHPNETTVVDDGDASTFRVARDEAQLRAILAELAAQAGVPAESLPFLTQPAALLSASSF